MERALVDLWAENSFLKMRCSSCEHASSEKRTFPNLRHIANNVKATNEWVEKAGINSSWAKFSQVFTANFFRRNVCVFVYGSLRNHSVNKFTQPLVTWLTDRAMIGWPLMTDVRLRFRLDLKIRREGVPEQVPWENHKCIQMECVA